MTDEFISRTNYFNKPWTWVKTIVTIIFILLFLLLWESVDQGTEYSWIKYLVFTVLVFGIATAPVDDLAVDKNNFYHFRKSILPLLSKTTKFEISKIKSIRSGGQHTESMEFLQFLTMNNIGGRRNTIELTLTDDSYRSLDVAIYRKDLQTMVSKVKELTATK